MIKTDEFCSKKMTFMANFFWITQLKKYIQNKITYSAWPNKREGDDWFVRIKNMPRQKSEGQKCGAYGVKCDFLFFISGTW